MVTYLDATTPADTEAAALGASRIRALEAKLNAIISMIWNSSGNFLPGWITGSGSVEQNPSLTNLFAPAAVDTPDIAPGAITEALLAVGALGADAYGRSIMANGFLLPTHLASGFEMPNNTVPGLAIAPSGIQTALQNGVNPVGLGCLTAAMMVNTIAQAFVGQYAGSNSSSAVINTVPFAPSVVIVFQGTGINGFGVGLQAESNGTTSPIHASWATGAIASVSLTALEFSSNGFTIVPFNYAFNQAGQTHTFIALQFA